MEAKKVEFIMSLCRDKFKITQLVDIKKQLEDAEDSKYALVQSINFKDPNTALIISVVAGGLGADRFYLDDMPMGLLKLFTGGACGIWWLIDIFSVSDRAKDWNYRQLQMVLNGYVI